jgi:hypothetical protein
MFGSGGGQSKANGESWTGSRANPGIVVQIPNRRLAGARIEQQIVRFSVPVKIVRSREIVSRHNRWPKRAADTCGSRQIPDHRVMRARVEQQK